MKLIIIILIIVGIWFAHSKMGISFGKIGAALFLLVAWALKTSGGEEKQIKDMAGQVQHADDDQLVAWTRQYDNQHLNNMAARELQRRYGDNWRRYV